MKLPLRCRFGFHSWDVVTHSAPTGKATLGFGLFPRHELKTLEGCKRCPTIRSRGSRVSVLSREQEAEIFGRHYDKDGWPIDAKGNKLPIAD